MMMPNQTLSAIVVDEDNLQSTLVSSDVVEQRGHDPLIASTEVRPVGLQEVARALRRATLTMEGVTQEQINRVRKMHDTFAEGAEMNFNYNTLLLVASVLAGLGLAAGSTTTVIASMLVSPIMGPVVAVAYGETISDRKLVWQALRTECLSLLWCILVGAIIGGAAGWTEMAEDWPNAEQAGRCTWTNFFVGLPVAFFSGLGVAVSLLDEQTNSLVGVAISASLLPPAVNAGMMWVAYGYFDKNRKEAGAYDDDYINSVSRGDFRYGGFISLLLTIANIVLVIVASMIMFRLKERLPIRKKVFWEDLRVARKIYQNRAFLAEESPNDQQAPTLYSKAVSPGNVDMVNKEDAAEETEVQISS